MPHRCRLLVVLSLVTVSACSKPAPKKADLQRMATALQSGVEPVSFQTLQEFLPSSEFLASDGWQKNGMSGMALAEPVRGSQAQLTIRKGDTKIVIDIIDTVFNQSIYAPVATFLAQGFSTNDEIGYKKAITIQNQPAFEEWARTDRHAGITVLVGKRFLVHLQGTGFSSTDPVKAIAGQINMAKLAALK